MSESINQSYAESILRLGNECRDLANERDALKEHIRYLEIELKCETGRWERTMQDVERLRKAGDWVISHWSSGDGSDEVRFCQALLKWSAAKEGKTSA